MYEKSIIFSTAEKICDIFNAARKYINEMPKWQIFFFYALFFVVFLLQMNFMALNPDTILKWHFTRYYSETGRWLLEHPEHHQSRWMITMPVLIMSKIFGTQPWVPITTSILFASLSLAFVWLLVKECSDRFTALSVYIILVCSAHFAVGTYTWRPNLYASLFLFAAIYTIIKYLKGQLKLRWIFASGLLLGLGWGCKVTTAYWCVAIGLFMIFFDTPSNKIFRIWKINIGYDVLLLTAGFMAVFIPETLILNHCFGLQYGRIQMLTMGHFHNRLAPQYMNFFEYLLSFKRPLLTENYKGGLWPLAVSFTIFFLFAFPLAIAWLKDKTAKTYLKFLAFIFIVVYFIHCYAVYKVFPFLHPERPNMRYYLELGMAAVIIVSIGWDTYAAFFSETNRTFRIYVLTFISFCIVFICVECTATLLKRNIDSFGKLHSISKETADISRSDMPVLIKLRYNGKSKERPHLRMNEYKNARRFIGFWGPVKRISEMYYPRPTPPIKYFIFSKKGACFGVLWGNIPQNGKKQKCAIVDGYSIKIHNVQF